MLSPCPGVLDPLPHILLAAALWPLSLSSKPDCEDLGKSKLKAQRGRHIGNPMTEVTNPPHIRLAVPCSPTDLTDTAQLPSLGHPYLTILSGQGLMTELQRGLWEGLHFPSPSPLPSS